MTGPTSGIERDSRLLGPDAGQRSLAASVWIAIGALLFPLLVASLVTVLAGDWELTGAGTLLIAALIAATGAASAMIAGHHPLTYGFLAGEAWAVGSLPDPVGVTFTLGAGLAGGWIGSLLMTRRSRDPRAVGALGAVAAVGGALLLITGLIVQTASSGDTEEAALPYVPADSADCPPSMVATEERGAEVALTVPRTDLSTGEPIPVEVNHRIDDLDVLEVPDWTRVGDSIFIAVRSEADPNLHWAIWKGGGFPVAWSGGSDGTADPHPCPRDPSDERRFSTDAPPGRYEVTALWVVGEQVWSSYPVTITVK
jgi:hypothetical protein